MDSIPSLDGRARGVFAGALTVPLAMAPLMASVDVAFGRKEWTAIPPILAAVTLCGALSLAACVLAPRYVIAALRAGAGLLIGFSILGVMAVVAEVDAGSDLL